MAFCEVMIFASARFMRQDKSLKPKLADLIFCASASFKEASGIWPFLKREFASDKNVLYLLSRNCFCPFVVDAGCEGVAVTGGGGGNFIPEASAVGDGAVMVWAIFGADVGKIGGATGFGLSLIKAGGEGKEGAMRGVGAIGAILGTGIAGDETEDRLLGGIAIAFNSGLSTIAVGLLSPSNLVSKLTTKLATGTPFCRASKSCCIVRIVAFI